MTSNGKRKTYKTLNPEQLDTIVSDVLTRERPLVSVFASSCVLQMDESTICRMCRAGKLKAVKVGKYWRINRNALLEFAGLN